MASKKKVGSTPRRSLAFAAVTAAGLMAAAPAWACTTSAATTNVNPTSGAPGTKVEAYTTGSNLPAGNYDMYFLDHAQVASLKTSQYHHNGTVIGGPVTLTTSGSINSTPGTIPNPTSLGLAKVYFGKVSNRSKFANPANFLVN